MRISGVDEDLPIEISCALNPNLGRFAESCKKFDRKAQVAGLPCWYREYALVLVRKGPLAQHSSVL